MMLTLLLPVFCIGAESSKLIEDAVTAYFADIFHLSKSEIRLKYIHLPKEALPEGENYRYLVESKQTLPRLGYQTIWLKVYDNQSLIKQVPVTVDLSIWIDVVVAAKKMKRGEKIEQNKISIKRITISRDYRNLIREPDSAVGLITKQVVKEGEPLKQSILREPPDVFKGDKVNVKLVSGDLVVTDKGEVKEDGLIGEKVKVYCETTRKLVYGTVQSPELVIIQIK
ncbi:MAG TPA: flagella basal body P-ring formation protein FlgA [Candidatus Marinimicrobia bacterium]|nr:flagella basal body P-ring formation protein FlgA [Candidatus Neomarinimicrobiota bacterium]